MVNFSVREGGRDMKEKENAECTSNYLFRYIDLCIS